MTDELREKLAEPVKQALAHAEDLARERDHATVTAAHLFLAILERSPGVVTRTVPSIEADTKIVQLREELMATPSEDDNSLAQVLDAARALAAKEGEDKAGLRQVVCALADVCGLPASQAPVVSARPAAKPRRSVPTPTLDEFGRDLTREAEAGELHPILGRDDEIDLVIETLCRTDKPNALLVGPAGVGKTAIVEGVAQRVAAGEVPPYLQGARIVELQPSNLVAGTGVVGTLQERMKKIIEEAQRRRGDGERAGTILFIDEFHSAVGAGGAMGLQDVASQLKPALGRGNVACIGATTDREYERHIRMDTALERRFDLIRINELSTAHTLELLKARRARWERRRGVAVEDKALEEAVRLAGAHLRNRQYPDKAIDVLERAVAFVYARGGSTVDVSAVRQLVERVTGVPVDMLRQQLSDRLTEMADFLKGRVLGQDDIIDDVVHVLRPKLLGLDVTPERPNGVLFFTGPTGVGKTELARRMAEFLHGGRHKLLQFNMSEFSEPHMVTRLTGAPPSYIGFDMGTPLLDEVIQNPFSILLLDEMEKAHPAVHQLFLQVFDSGVLTDNQGRHIYFSDVVVVMTANIQEFSRRRVGFPVGHDEARIEREDPRATLRRHFPPEFVNRIDYVGLFHDLPPEIVRGILEKRIIPELQERWRLQGIELEVSPEAVALIAEKGFDEKSGARALQRVVDAEVLPDVSRFIGKGKPDAPVRLRVNVRNGSLAVQAVKGGNE